MTANTFSAGPPAPGFTPCNNAILIILGSCQALSPTDLANAVGLKDMRRCPGSNERGLTNDQLTQGGTVNCNPSQVPVGQ